MIGSSRCAVATACRNPVYPEMSASSSTPEVARATLVAAMGPFEMRRLERGVSMPNCGHPVRPRGHHMQQPRRPPGLRYRAEGAELGSGDGPDAAELRGLEANRVGRRGRDDGAQGKARAGLEGPGRLAVG